MAEHARSGAAQGRLGRTKSGRSLAGRFVGRGSRPSLGVTLALVLLGGIAITGLAADFLAPYDPNAQDLGSRLCPPMWVAGGSGSHVLGCDQVGRDILSRLIYGGRLCIVIAVLAVLCAGLIGTVLGIIAGYYGGLVDELIMRVADIQLSIPMMLFAIVFMAVFGTSLPNLVLVLTIYSWVVYARILRGQVLSVRREEYVTALLVLGATSRLIMFGHIVRNVAGSVIVVATLETANIIVFEAGLSFLGLGVDPAIPDWGSMLSDGRNYITTAWWLAACPGIAITVTVLCISVVGDWLADRMNPLLRR